MKKSRVFIVKTAGTNCDGETAFAFTKAGAETDTIHINKIIHNDVKLTDYHIFAIPGGFTYGDDIASGKILANELRYIIQDKVEAFHKQGGLTIGICNGFQVLVKSNLLPGNSGNEQPATLTFNDCGNFECRWIRLQPNEKSPCVFTKGMKTAIELPIAHGEGKFMTRSADDLNSIEKNNLVVFRYCNEQGAPAADFPENPNGSVNGIAGICNETGRIFGLMPHPERFVLPMQHPQHTRRDMGDEGMGMALFRNAVSYVTEHLL